MAEFNITPQAQPPGSYTGMSEGLRSSPNTAMGSLFEGLANTLDMGVKEADRNVKANIEEDIFDEVDAVQAEFGIPEATDLEADAEEVSERTSPVGVTRAKGQLENLQTAYARGALKESHYWARMNSMVRQLRGKYPGYRGEIDQMVAGVTGARPANALRSALMREWEDAASEESSMSKLEDWAVKQGRLPVDYYDRQGAENPYTMTELQAHIARKTRDDAERDSRRASMAESTDRGALTATDVEKSFRIEATQFVTSTLQDASTQAGASYAQIQTRLREAQQAQASGNPLPQADVDTLRGMMGELKSTVRMALHQQYIQSWDGNPQHSYLANLNKDKMAEIIDQAMVPLTTLEQALTSENPWGVLGATAAWLEAQKVDSSRELLRDMPMAQEMAAMSNVLGSDVLSQYLTLSPSLQRDVDESLVTYRKLRAARSLENGETVSDAFADGEAKERGADYYNSLTDHWVKMADQISKQEIPLETLQNNVNYMFGAGSDRVLSMLDDASRFEYFKKVSSPAVTRQMQALRDQGDTDSWEKYQRWVANSFQVLFTQKVSTLQEMVVQPDNFEISWNDSASRFRVRALRDRMAGSTLGTSVDAVTQRAERSISQLNDAIVTVAPIVRDNGGDPSREVLSLLTRMGYDPDAPATQPIVNMMVEAIREFISENVKVGPGATASQGNRQYRPSSRALVRDMNNMFGAE